MEELGAEEEQYKARVTALEDALLDLWCGEEQESTSSEGFPHGCAHGCQDAASGYCKEINDRLCALEVKP